jgi:hypothetical protein
MNVGRELLVALENGTLPPAQFTHYNHVRAAWHCLQQLPLREAAHSFRDVLMSYVRKQGVEDKFHLTLTFAFMHLIHERIKATPGDWEDFVAANADLFSDARRLVSQYYSPGRLLSDNARRQFVEPDLAALP